ncbi:MAG: DUF1810 domain-containing protein [Candidatus Limnocylindrales bacterium]
MTDDPFALERFARAQDEVYAGVLDELRAGRKSGHWIWFIFPQLLGLGRSPTSRFYAIVSLEEARAYLAHPVLGPRLLACVDAVLALPAAVGAVDIFGELDARKVQSSMTLFWRAAPDEPRFLAMLERFYDGADAATDATLRGEPAS